jgi:putative sterol carrier protein
LAVLDRIKRVWNAFSGAEPEGMWDQSRGISTSYRPDRQRRMFSNERSIISSIYTRISVDVAGVGYRHVTLDEQNRFLKDNQSPLNDALMFEPNIDQGPRAFRQDIALTLFDAGVAAIVPVDTTVDPATNEVFDIYSLRVGTIVKWYPKHVRVRLYNEAKGTYEEITLEKRTVAIVENPLYGVMNEPNSTLQRLIRKLNLLDAVDEQSSSGKLDIIIQLPYVIKSEARKQQAEQRRSDIEFQLKGSQYGIAYTDGTEKITQLNRPAENNLLTQIEFLTKMLYEQLGITEAVMSGTADEKDMLNYYNRTVEPILDAIVEAMQRTFIGPVKLAKRERIKFFRDPFKLVPVKDIAEIADKFTRNEILTSNEIRAFMGLPPSTDPKADQLINSNMPQPAIPAEVAPEEVVAEEEAAPEETQTEDDAAIDLINEQLDSIIEEFGDLA